MEGLNPLHCGAVVASSIPRGARRSIRRVSIPFIAGQWSLQHFGERPGTPRGQVVSIPFIAGQWSLLRPQRLSGFDSSSLNPLHCGAVVASPDAPDCGGHPGRVSIPFIAGQWSLRRTPSGAPRRSARLNPLHCGAVVASYGGRMRKRRLAPRSQSPSLRGSGRFRRSADRPDRAARRSQSPSLRGSGRFSGGLQTHPPPAFGSQSPSLRGSGRFGRPSARALRRLVSQSPSLRGSGHFRRAMQALRLADVGSQSPSLRGSGRFTPRCTGSPFGVSGLNPLHCGAVVASP